MFVSGAKPSVLLTSSMSEIGFSNKDFISCADGSGTSSTDSSSSAIDFSKSAGVS